MSTENLMSDFVTPADVNAMKTEIAALKRENEILYKWLAEQKSHVDELRKIMLQNRGDAK
jgi:hypothetical protein